MIGWLINWFECEGHVALDRNMGPRYNTLLMLLIPEYLYMVIASSCNFEKWVWSVDFNILAFMTIQLSMDFSMDLDELDASHVGNLDEYDEASSMKTTYCYQMTREEYEAQAATETHKALQVVLTVVILYISYVKFSHIEDHFINIW